MINMNRHLRFGNAWKDPIGKPLTDARITYWVKQGKYEGKHWIQKKIPRTKHQKIAAIIKLFDF